MNKTFKFHLEQILVFVLMLGVFSYGMRTGLGHAAMLTWLFALAAFSYGHSVVTGIACAASSVPFAIAIFVSNKSFVASGFIVLVISLLIGSSSLDEIKKSDLSYSYALFWLALEFSVIAGPLLYFIWKYQEEIKVLINF